MVVENVDIINFNDCPLSEKNGMYGGMAGTKNGIIYNGEQWMIKYPKNTKSMENVRLSYTTAPLCEYIGSHIYDILGYDVHETLLGERNGKIVVGCKDFEQNGEKLIEMRTIKNAENHILSEELNKSFSSTSDKHYVNLDTLLLHIKYNEIINKIQGIEQRFWDMAVVDIFIGNADRNNGNWGILRKNGHDRIAPVFDNGGCFNDKYDDEQLMSLIENDDRMLQAATNFRTVFAVTNKENKLKQLNAKGLIEYAINYPVFIASWIKNMIRIQEKMQDIKNLVNSIPEFHNGMVVCSKAKKRYICSILDVRYEKLILPTLKKIQIKLQSDYRLSEEIEEILQNIKINDKLYSSNYYDEKNMYNNDEWDLER